MALTNKRVVLGVTGGIAAYKSAELVRRLRDAGADVRVVMTRAATEFITPLTMQAVSGHPVHLQLLNAETESAMGHIDLARWADTVLIAPASANFIAKLVQGRADDLLTTLCLATAAPIAIAPAMNQQMWHNAATQENIALLQARGMRIYGPGQGAQACGEVGPGRMLEPGELLVLLAGQFESGLLEGVCVMLTAGPTREAIDPARFISNHSSGQMGYALATAAMEAGARVTLIAGPTALADPERITTVHVTSAQEMFDAVHARIADTNLFIGVAAVADYRPRTPATDKIKKDAETRTLDLVRNPDIVASVAALPTPPFTVGFAAESCDVEANARAKLAAKNLDLIVANPIGIPGSGFASDTNAVTIIDRTGTTALAPAAKSQLARTLIQHIAGRFNEKGRSKNTRQARRH